jgi:hypothetical protein
MAAQVSSLPLICSLLILLLFVKMSDVRKRLPPMDASLNSGISKCILLNIFNPNTDQ